MSKTALLASFLIAGVAPTAFAPATFAQTSPKPDKAAMKSKKDACRAEATAKNLVKADRKTFMDNCLKR
jgi:hypothetical protein